MELVDTNQYSSPVNEYEFYKAQIGSWLPLGLPEDPVSSLPPAGLETTLAARGEAPQITTVQGIWNSITTFAESAGNTLESGIKGAYGKVKEAAGTVYDDVSSPVSSAFDNIYWKVIIAAVVVGGVIYFAGRSGAVRISR